ncbi:NADH-ubiquinone oxidoreductase-F iron-sulfur binding region domain-containing protein [Cloacibacillus evryensis]|nr:NADH-ubiquinone oxidoreductase-F iron-sulfur binding region domain-containing protein [Cloacibacillus evryensis]
MGPLVRIEPQGWLYVKVKPEDCSEIIEKTIVGGEHIARLAYAKNGEIYKKQGEIPFYKKQTRHVLEHCGHIDATSIKEYLAIGGYSAFERALFDMNGDEIVGMIEESNLRGRGGGGFPTGRKWSQVKRQNAEHKYIVCNGDEGDPGAFMDRSIMEGDPHRMLEGMMIAGLACGAQNGYIYVRAEYPMAVSRLRTAIAQAEELGLLGGDILGSGFSFRMHINRGAGAFVCGEGSALTASIEGKRGMPRVKPPRTVEHGLFDSPTVLNNVETFANVPLIINKGVAWYKTLGPEKSPGTKAFALTGNIENTGLIEVPMGTTLREIVFEVGGGMRGGADFKAVQIGGPSGGCLTVKDLDLPLDFDSLKAAGAMIGSGGLVVMDSRTCMVEVARFFMNFTQNESCGKCVPCRGGTKQMLAILERIVAGEGREGDIDLLLELADMISHTALCGLGKTAALPVVSTIKNFREEYEAHISKKYCPVGACAKLKSFEIDPALCKGCSKCARGCPVEAICGKIKEPFTIDKEKCIKCGACVTACPFHAVKEV